LSVVFNPATAGTATGQLTITSTSSTNSVAVINLSGTGQTAYQVNVTWVAPASSADPVAGYHIYRSPSGSSTYQLMGSVSSSQLAYTDTSNIVNGQAYDYIVESVDSSGNESAPSNTATVSVPAS
jgi:fibronectin type 3 domain-containing protein